VLWLPLTFVLSFGFGQAFKWSQRRGCHAPTVVAANYLSLALLLLLYLAGTGQLHLDAPTTRVGAIMGLSFIVSMLAMTRALELVPVATVLTAFRLAILVPIAASVLLWGEAVDPVQVVGIALAVAALGLMTMARLPRTARPGRTGPVAGPKAAVAALTGLCAFAVFLPQGLSQVCLRWVHSAGLSEQRRVVLAIAAATAGLLGAAAVACQRYRPQPRDLAMGAGIGAYNLICLAVLLTALSRVPGTLFFPLHGCAVVILDNAFAHLYWREALDRWTVAGAGLGACAMLLVL